jgi:hypothetical protein
MGPDLRRQLLHAFLGVATAALLYYWLLHG